MSKPTTDRKNQTVRTGHGFVRAKAAESNSRLLQILTTKPQPTVSQHIYKRLDGWPGLRPISFARVKSLSTKALKRQPSLATTANPSQVTTKYIKPFSRVTLYGETLSLIPSSFHTTRRMSDKGLPRQKKSTQLLRMDRYENARPTNQSVQQVLQQHASRDPLQQHYKIDFEAFNYIDKVIDFKELWREYVRKTDRS